MYMYMCTYVCMCAYIYIYIYICRIASCIFGSESMASLGVGLHNPESLRQGFGNRTPDNQGQEAQGSKIHELVVPHTQL